MMPTNTAPNHAPETPSPVIGTPAIPNHVNSLNDLIRTAQMMAEHQAKATSEMIVQAQTARDLLALDILKAENIGRELSSLTQTVKTASSALTGNLQEAWTAADQLIQAGETVKRWVEEGRRSRHPDDMPSPFLLQEAHTDRGTLSDSDVESAHIRNRVLARLIERARRQSETTSALPAETGTIELFSS